MNAGADAVYLAGNRFGARAYAKNFSDAELVDAVQFAHLRGVAVHATTNTILRDDELDAFAEYVKFLRDANVDALLVQDLGAASIAKRCVPEIPLHASTQMTVHNLEGVLALAELGFSRVVLSREMTLPEIEYIAEHSPIEIEIFAHGALCVCWSGQCLMSSMIGARSGNRGKCAQPCRLPYTLIDADGHEVLKDAGEYLLSPKDLNTLNMLPRLVNAGVASLKIEGRMKRAEYVATVVNVYRHALDSCNATSEEHRQLAQIFNRDFTTAYLERNPGKNLISDKRPNNRGVLVGRVTNIGGNTITLKLVDEIHVGDQIEIWVKVGGRVTFTVNKFTLDNNLCTIAVESTRGVRMNDRAFKIFDAELTATARTFFNGDNSKRIAVTADVHVKIGEPLTLTMIDADGNSATAVTDFIAEPAKNRPLTAETLTKQLGRLGNSVFVLDKLRADIDDDLMMPISELNEVRRKVTYALESQRLAKFAKHSTADRHLPATHHLLPTIHYSLIAHVDTIDKMTAALDNGADAILYGGETFNNRNITPQEISQAAGIVHLRGKEFYLATPRIVRDDEIADLEKIITAADVDAVYVHSLATLNIAKRLTAAPVHTDFSLTVSNHAAIEFLQRLGVDAVTLSPELTLAQIKSLAKISCLPVECIVHGKTELMISAYCVLGSFVGDIGNKKCSRVCRRNNYFLRDRKNILFPVVTDQFCRMHILNSKTLSMIEHRAEFEGIASMRVDCRAMTIDETAQIVRAYKYGGTEIRDFTRGHYFRGVD